MQEFGKGLVIAGGILVGLGTLLWATGGAGFWSGIWKFCQSLPRLGRLPGDLWWEREGMSFGVPLTTCLLLSVVLTVLGWFWRR
jgi:hypothetical protein